MIDFDVRGRLAVITMNRPEARNAVNGAVSAGLRDAVERLEADDDLWAGVIAGNGPVFSAGADLKEVSAGRADANVVERGGFAGITRLERSKPLIAAVDGPALAGGCEVALSCDLVVASTAASFGIPEVKRGLIAGAGGLFRLPRTMPLNWAMELALTGDSFSAERAYQAGLVNELCEPGTAVEHAIALGERICRNAPLAVRASRDVMLRTALAADADAWRINDEAIEATLATDDVREGSTAFVEKREPVWSGR
jgi:enoyl-CoA hydratase